MGPWELIYDRAVLGHLATIERRHHSFIRSTIEERLRHEPEVETRNRKPLRRPPAFGATWELRFGPDNRFWVFYKIRRERREVHILAIGEKQGNRLTIGGTEYEL
jgi:hypothetical protein